MKLFDLSRLSKLLNNDKESLKHMLTVFMDASPDNIATLNDAYEAKDCQGIRKGAHKLKSTIDIMQILALHDIVRQLEQCDETQLQDENIKEMIGRVTETFKAIYPCIKEEIQNMNKA